MVLCVALQFLQSNPGSISSRWTTGVIFESSWLIHVQWAALQHRVLIFAGNIPLASFIPVPAHAADDDCADDDSGYHCSDN